MIGYMYNHKTVISETAAAAAIFDAACDKETGSFTPEAANYTASLRDLPAAQEEDREVRHRPGALSGTAKQPEAADIFKRIRSGADPAAIIRHLSAADPPLQLQLKPEMRYGFEFPYQKPVPASLQLPGDPYLRSLVYECTYLRDGNIDAATALIMGPLGERRQTPYLKPLHAAFVADSRFEEVTPSKWTSVSADDAPMRTLLQAFFLHEYSYFTFFQTDHFLDDMLAGGGDLCSPLLVNAVLALGCVSAAGGLNVISIVIPGSRIEQSSGTPKDAQRHTITFVQATLIINVLVNISRMDKLGCDIKDPGLRRSRDFTAWCVFWWQSTFSFYFMTVPLVSEPPKTPPPDPEEDPSWYGELWLRYHLNDALVPTSFGHVQRAKLELLLISSKAILAVSGRDEAELGEQAAEKICEALQELRGWYAVLPEPLVPQKIVFPSQLKIQPDAVSALISSGHDDPRTALARSRAYFETVMRLYYLRHGFDRADMMMIQFLSLLAITSLD
ncbi:hypothetical protein ACJZ2D_000162 [Fusarium nematophilum]